MVTDNEILASFSDDNPWEPSRLAEHLRMSESALLLRLAALVADGKLKRLNFGRYVIAVEKTK